MTSTPIQTSMPFAGSRLKTCCGKLVGCACRRSNLDNINSPKHFSSNFSLSSDVKVFYTFRKCDVASCKVKCTENRMVLPSNNFKSHVNKRGFVILTDENLTCSSSNIIYLMSCRICLVASVVCSILAKPPDLPM